MTAPVIYSCIFSILTNHYKNPNTDLIHLGNFYASLQLWMVQSTDCQWKERHSHKSALRAIQNAKPPIIHTISLCPPVFSPASSMQKKEHKEKVCPPAKVHENSNNIEKIIKKEDSNIFGSCLQIKK